MKKISALIIASSIGIAAQAQIIDALTGSLAAYTTYMVNDVSAGAGRGVSFSTSGTGLSANYVGTGTTAEQGLLLAPASSFSTTFAVGQTLSVSTAISSSTTAQDFGLAIASASPVAASAGNSWNSRTAFDWMSISIRPNGSGGTIRVNTSVSGTLNTASFALSPTLPVNGLYIDWTSATTFAFGYIDTSSVKVQDGTITFAGASTIGTDIGFYADLRSTGTSLGTMSNLAIAPVPEPSSLALCGMSFIGLLAVMRRKK